MNQPAPADEAKGMTDPEVRNRTSEPEISDQQVRDQDELFGVMPEEGKA